MTYKHVKTAICPYAKECTHCLQITRLFLLSSDIEYYCRVAKEGMHFDGCWVPSKIRCKMIRPNEEVKKLVVLKKY